MLRLPNFLLFPGGGLVIPTGVILFEFLKHRIVQLCHRAGDEQAACVLQRAQQLAMLP